MFTRYHTFVVTHALSFVSEYQRVDPELLGILQFLGKFSNMFFKFDYVLIFLRSLKSYVAGNSEPYMNDFDKISFAHKGIQADFMGTTNGRSLVLRSGD